MMDSRQTGMSSMGAGLRGTMAWVATRREGLRRKSGPSSFGVIDMCGGNPWYHGPEVATRQEGLRCKSGAFFVFKNSKPDGTRRLSIAALHVAHGIRGQLSVEARELRMMRVE